jgi:hypothetical protein
MRRIPRTVGALLTAVVLSLGSLGTSVAALPNVEHHADPASPTTASNSAVAHFHVFAINNDTSTVSQFFLFATTTGSVRSATPSVGNCTQSGALSCVFGQFRPGDRIDVFVDFNTAASGTTGDVKFDWNSTGTPPDKKGRSHGDNFEDIVALPLNPSNDFRGTYVADSSLTIVANGNSLGNSNKQATIVVSPVTGIPITVQDGSFIPCEGVNVTCPTTLFGETSQLNVGDGGSFGLFPVTLQLYKPGVNPSQVNGIYHQWTDTAGDHDELITAHCPTDVTPTDQCFTATKLGSQNLQIVVWLLHNGHVGGY